MCSADNRPNALSDISLLLSNEMENGIKIDYGIEHRYANVLLDNDDVITKTNCERY